MDLICKFCLGKEKEKQVPVGIIKHGAKLNIYSIRTVSSKVE